MKLPTLILVFCCLYHNLVSASGHGYGHNIPVEGYDSELQDLGQHVEIPETPVKVVKITKTIAVKIPVPYPVKVKEKVPYPVHVSKPYPVPVPHIVHVPQSSHGHTPHEQLQDFQAGAGAGGYQHDAPHSFPYQEDAAAAADGPYTAQHTQTFDGNSDGGDPFNQLRKY